MRAEIIKTLKNSNIPKKTTCKQLQNLGWFITSRQLNWLKSAQAELKFSSINSIVDWEYNPPLTVNDTKVKTMINDWKKGNTLPLITVTDISCLSYGYKIQDVISRISELTENRKKNIEQQIYQRSRRDDKLILEGHHRYTAYKTFNFKQIPVIVLYPEFIKTSYIK
jgi:hypothetical protein